MFPYLLNWDPWDDDEDRPDHWTPARPKPSR